MEKCASSIYSQMLHFKTCQLPGEGDCVLSSSLASPIAYLASKATLSSSYTLSHEHDDPWPTSTTINGCFLRISAANNRKIMHLVINIKRYISRHVNYLGVVFQHHLHPLLPAQQYGWLPALPPPSVVNVRVLRKLVQAAINVSFPFLRPTTLQHKENVNYRQQSITYNVSEKDKVK